MARIEQKRHRVTDIPTAPDGARPDEVAALAPAAELAKQFRAAGGTLTVRLEGVLVKGARAVVYHFHSVAQDASRKLVNAEFAAWNSFDRVLLVAGQTGRYCRTPAEAVQAALATLAEKRANGIRSIPSKVRYGRNVDPKTAFVRGRLVNRKVLPE